MVVSSQRVSLEQPMASVVMVSMCLAETCRAVLVVLIPEPVARRITALVVLVSVQLDTQKLSPWQVQLPEAQVTLWKADTMYIALQERER